MYGDIYCTDRKQSNMAGVNASMKVNDFDSVLDLVHQQASKFFTGM